MFLPHDSIALLVVVILVAAVGVFWSGTRLTIAADRLAQRFDLSRVFVGALLLGVATSLPEVATTVTAASVGEASLAGSNLLGGVALQMCVLAVVDMMLMRGKALTFFIPRAVLLVQGVMLVLSLAAACAAIAVGPHLSFAGVEIASFLLVALYILSLRLVLGYDGAQPRWLPAGRVADEIQDILGEKGGVPEEPLHKLVVPLAANMIGVVLCGWAIASSADALAEQTGISTGFLGATLVAAATSLPEVSTSFAAVRRGAYGMAVGNILGTNSLEVALLGGADVVHTNGSFYGALDNSTLFLGTLGIALTCIYLWGMLERSNRTVMGMGVDSAIVLGAYLLGMLVYSQLF